MKDRFKFDAIVKFYYLDIDDNEKWIKILLRNVAVMPNGEVGLSYDDLETAVYNTKLTAREIKSLLEIIQDYYLYDDWINLEPENIMQCTGLKDKNGKLIYEGDIVKRTKFKNGNILIGKVIYCEDEARYKILISDNDKYSYKDYTKIVNLYDVAYHLEIIGNICH